MSKAALIACFIAAPLAGACSGESLSRTPAPVAASQSLMLTPARCSPPSVTDGPGLMPDAVVAILSVDMRSVQRGAFGTKIESVAASTREGRDTLAALKTCGLPPRTIERITVGADLADGVVVVVEAKGVGTDATLDCLHHTIKKQTGASPWTKTRSACTTALELKGDDEIVYAAGKNTLVMASKSLDEAVQMRLSGHGTKALSSELKWATSSVDMRQTAWAAVEVRGGLATMVSSLGADRVSVSIDTDKGLDVALKIEFTTVAAAEKIENNAQMLPAMGPMAGVPQGVIDSLKVDRRGSQISFEVFVSPSDLETLVGLM